MATQAPPGLDSQYRAMREASALFEPSRGGALRVKGPDAVEFLQGQVTNNVAALEPGSGCYALLLNPKGRILADMRILMLSGDELLLLSDQEAMVGKNLGMYKIGRQVEIEVAGSAVLHLIGPAAAEAAGVPAPAAEHAFTEGEVGGIPVLVVRTRLGINVVHPADHPIVLDALRARATESASEEAAEIARIEAGLPRYGADMTADNFPGELGLEERAVSFTKGCYVGQEPVARMHHRGHPNRHLRGLELSRPAVPGESLERDGKEVGTITSAAVSPALGPIALALVRREVDPGDRVELDGAGATGTVVELPFERSG